jgi:predicted MarR family transcription regulator
LKTIAVHTQKLVQAGLVNKTYRGREVAHSVSPYGETFLAFIKTFSHS